MLTKLLLDELFLTGKSLVNRLVQSTFNTKITRKTMTFEYIISNIMILLTVCLIPFALKSKNRMFTLAAIIIPLIANISLYIAFDQQPSFGYLALVGAVSLLLIRKNKKKEEG